jgi:hypothetical protein
MIESAEFGEIAAAVVPLAILLSSIRRILILYAALLAKSLLDEGTMQEPSAWHGSLSMLETTPSTAINMPSLCPSDSMSSIAPVTVLSTVLFGPITCLIFISRDQQELWVPTSPRLHCRFLLASGDEMDVSLSAGFMGGDNEGACLTGSVIRTEPARTCV